MNNEAKEFIKSIANPGLQRTIIEVLSTDNLTFDEQIDLIIKSMEEDL